MKGWAFYNSDGELVGGFDGAWKFYNSDGEVLVPADDAGDVEYTPSVLTDWDSDADPGDVNDALDQLAERIDDTEISEATAIHDNIAGEINAITEKATPVDADLVIIEDSEDSNNKKKVQLGNLPGGGGATITVEEEDGNPSVNDVDTVIFDQADGFSVTDNADGSVTIGMAAGGGVDADDVTYTPTTLADWDGGSDPGDVEQALDQLAERVTDLEAGGGGGGGDSFHPFLFMGA
jgi:hypothetical protein